ncbi:MAG TPA: hypothetical protein HPP97_10440 [Desulfuromonadales bacterium]|nr:hypothetical protein [Desulfuromonadales bacterium]
MTPPILIIEPNLRNPSGHYAEFVRAVGTRAGDTVLEVYAHPEADAMLREMPGVQVCTNAPRTGQSLAEWRTIARAVKNDNTFLVLTSDGRHSAAVAIAAAVNSSNPDKACLFFHRAPTTVRDRFFLPFAGRAKEHALAIAPTAIVAAALRASGWQRVVCVPYPALGAAAPPHPVPLSHLLMAGAARLNKGLDIISELAIQWAQEGRTTPLFVQVSKKHAAKHGHREAGVVESLLASGYTGLVTDETPPGRPEYLKRFTGALVLAPYAREQFASQVSGIVLDALLHGAPVIATRGTWPGDQVERFDAGITITERTPAALIAAIDTVIADWPTYAANACAAAQILAQEHDPRHLLDVIRR